MTPLVSLREHRLRVEAPPALCFQVVASAGRTMEQRSEREKVVRFETQVRGTTIVTTELLRLDPPNRIDYRWLDGPLPAVEETIDFAADDGGCMLRYRGRFRTPHRGLRGRIEAVLIRRMFDRPVREHLAEAKRIAEARARRSRVFARERAGEAP